MLQLPRGATIALMRRAESIYFPVVQIIVGTAAGALFAKLVSTNLGGWSHLVFILAALGATSLLRDAWGMFHQIRLHRSCRAAYDKVARIFKPEILNPQHPGNPDFMREDAQRAVDDTTVLLDRLGEDHPDNINIDDDASVSEWYEYLRPLRKRQF